MAAHRAQLKSPGGWVLAGCGACVGLGYLASSLLSRSRTFGSAATGSDFPDVVETERPHPEWKPPQRQPPPEGSEKGLVFSVFATWYSSTGMFLQVRAIALLLYYGSC